MYALIVWTGYKTKSVIGIDKLEPDKDEGEETMARFDDGRLYNAKIVRKSDDEKYLNMLPITTDGEVMVKNKNTYKQMAHAEKAILKKQEKLAKKEREAKNNTKNKALLDSDSIFDDGFGNSGGTSSSDSESNKNQESCKIDLDQQVIDLDNDPRRLKKILTTLMTRRAPKRKLVKTTISFMIKKCTGVLMKLRFRRRWNRQEKESGRSAETASSSGMPWKFVERKEQKLVNPRRKIATRHQFVLHLAMKITRRHHKKTAAKHRLILQALLDFAATITEPIAIQKIKNLSEKDKTLVYSKRREQ
ncbi:uncharacterized protein LOC131675166 [Phymastichus coffea]|uniref:uncharacterized protein LOC131675166 n=1 Tax=Phymastichus coffea TaxID=108790 RepID=UPI00273B4A89|nr:uncharacterized protein LOC131675166 [Phymastichus coffea]